MSIKSLMCVCGTSIALGLVSAMAQQDSTTQPERPTTRTTTATSGGQMEDLLSKREGVWQVEVQLNKDFWSKMGKGHAKVDQSYITERGERDRTPSDQVDPSNTDRGTKPTDRKPTDQADRDDPSNPWYNRPDGQDKTTTTQPGVNNQQGVTSTTQPGMTRLSGYAESNLVLGENCLQERIVVPMNGDMNLDPSAPDTKNNNDVDTRPSTDALGAAMDDGSYRAISFIQFNENNRTYDMVFLCNQAEGMKYESGYFDAQRNRVVFRGKHDANWTRKTTDWEMREGAGDQPSIDRSYTDRKPAPGEQTDSLPDQTQRSADQPESWRSPDQMDSIRSPASHGMKDIVVVLEFMDDDTHKVTMYDASSSSGMQNDWTTDPNRPSTDRELDRDFDNDVDNDRDNDIDDLNDDLNDTLEDDRADDLDEPDLDDVQDDARDRQRETDSLNRQPTDSTRLTDRSRTSNDFGTVIYEATYTRAPSSMEASIRSMIDREITTVASR